MVYYYSACGNSRHVAESIASANNEQLLSIADIGNSHHSFVPKEGEALGLVFPTYSWRVPQIVSRFISRLRIEGRPSYLYMVTTYGDNAGIADRLFRRQLATVGLSLDAVFGIAMPNTYVNLSFMDIDAPELAQKKLDAAEQQISVVARQIASRTRTVDICRGSFPWFKSVVIGGLFERMTSDRAYYATDSCIACGRCAEVCPLHNITVAKPVATEWEQRQYIELNSPRPQWHGNCNHCEACYHHCPTNAIQYGKATRGKGQYYFGKRN